ncbi:testicular haploid expressed gene protein-like isoform X1 [Protobothrops mucrosquamatus]|uniref:testicular haploid expressed gene protein-like isoform X1 n=1 Tax=Protobothrops mucrosquamatus TaxID=103944 RepID=UPI000775E7BE|nr:testicular haploid expressed gene protein-like isoform X1 [Protobothrops mucrosquamatus]
MECGHFQIHLFLSASFAATSYGFYSNERLQELAKPKPTKDVWNFHRKLIWGNQEPIWPLSSRTLLRQPSSRILTLARPRETADKQKRSLFVFSCGQMSEIWKRSSTVYSAMPTKRLLKLAEPRPISATYLKLRPRSSPVWPVCSSALCSRASQRILTLAQPRTIHPNFSFPEQPEREISKAARRAEASPRLQQLAQPVVRKKMQLYEKTCMEVPIRQIPLTALQAVPSPRLLELARPKTIPSDSAMDRSPEWPVSVAAMQAVASPRLTELAHPPNRAPTNLVQFNPDAFIVKESAKKAFCTERVKHLAQPITR